MGEIRVKSGNLATDVNTWERAELSPTGIIVPTPTSGDYGITSDYIPITSGETYTYSHNNGFPANSVGTNSFRVIGWWDINKNWIKRDGNANDGSDLTITAPNNAAYARLCYKSYGNLEGCSFVTGSTALPYQPYFLNLPAHEKTADGWKDIPTHTMTANGWQGELTSQSPLEFRATGQSLMDWRVDGRTSGNLLDFNALENAPMGTLGTVSTCPHVLELQLKPSTTYTMASNGTGNETAMPASSYRSVYFADSASPNAVFVNHPVTVTTDLYGVIKVGFFSDRTNAQQYLNGTAHLWLIEGDTALPYEPYGGVGEKTENLLDLNRLPSDTWTTDTRYYMNGGIATSKTVYPEAVTISVNNDTLSVTTDGGNGAGFLVEAKPSTEYRLVFTKSESLDSSKTSCTYALVDTSETIGQLQAIYGNADGVVFTTDSNTKYVYFVFRKAAGTISYSNIMLVEGSTAPTAYIPYGYKIPVNVRGKNLFDSGFVVAATMTLNNNVHTVYFPVSVGEPRKTWFGNVESGRKYNIKLSNNDRLLIAGYTQRYTQAEIEAYTPSNQLTTSYAIYDGGLADDIIIDIPNNVVMIGVYYATSSAPTATLEVYYGTTTNLYTDHQLMDGDSLDFATDQTTIPITQGDNRLTVETAVQPSKVYVKFEG